MVWEAQSGVSLMGRAESKILTRLLWDLDVLGTYPTSGEFWACCIKFLEMTTFLIFGNLLFRVQSSGETSGGRGILCKC